MTTAGMILLVAYVAFVVGSLGYTIGFLLRKLHKTQRIQRALAYGNNG